MLFKSVILYLISLQFCLGLICHDCSESKIEPWLDSGGSCYTPDRTTRIDNYTKCESCMVGILHTEYPEEGGYGNV